MIIAHEELINEIIGTDLEYLGLVLRGRIVRAFTEERGILLNDRFIERLLPFWWSDYVRGN